MGLWARIWSAGYEFLGKRFGKIEERYRRRIVSDAHGVVLEIGAGTGFNFPFYEAAARVVAIEPEGSMRRRAERRAKTASVPIEVRPGNAHRLDFPEASFDVVVFSLVLCSIPNPDLALAEARRVLRPGGELRVYEHVRSHDPKIARRQDRFERPWRAFNVGCHPNRDTLATVERSGFDVSGVERFDMKGVPSLVRAHLVGTARKSEG